ncbi:MAG: polysaccharide biosynthesis/export family protein [bacterium]
MKPAILILSFAFVAAFSAPSFAQSVRYDLTGPLDEVYIPYDYPIGKGDRLRVTIDTGTAAEYFPMVGRNGNVILPIVGSVPVEGMTMNEATELLTELFSKYYREVYLNVQVQNPARIKIFLRGDVPAPGVYIVYSHTSFIELLQAVGLANSGAHRRFVHFRRKDGGYAASDVPALEKESEETYVKTEIDPLAITVGGKVGQNFLLRDGDIIEVEPPGKTVKITGTLRPGVYEILQGETLKNLLEISGSVDPYLDLGNAIVERHAPGGALERILLDFEPYADGEAPPDLELQNRDEIKIIARESRVFVIGSVNMPGAIPHAQNMSVLDYLSIAGPTDQAYLPKVIIIRQPRDAGKPITENEIIKVDMKALTKGKEPPSDYTIRPGDVIFVPDRDSRLDWRDVISMLSTLFIGINALR